ncbi:polyphenol oxidase, chloroplastic-like [Typha latifolia]|uniref:polyphenol oxidase, chloroplastic-like n=1 Tax=Typha latifolia TaxID=4733 RepID=UPI003C2DF125
MASIPNVTKPTNFCSNPSSACTFNNNQKLHLFPPPSFNSKIHHFKVSCKSTNDDRGNKLSGGGRLDRRELLFGLTGLYSTTAALTADRKALGLPIQAPDLSACGPPADVPSTVGPTDCCPPNSSKIVDFKLPARSSPLRVRPAAHRVDAEYLAKYTEAIAKMKALPADDPRNFTQQANVHCAYCDGAYDQVGFPDLELQIHNSWLFFPWHRFYLYFNERILGKLIGDDSFALPFWNWDAPDGMQLPSIYADPSSPLYDKLRDAKHQPPYLIDLDFNGQDPTFSKEEQIDHNLKIMYRQVVSNGKTTELFMGSPYRAGDQPDPGQGSLESVPHGPVHIWTGDRNQPNREDMGTFYSAGRDPIFFAHHGNVDRMWYLWKNKVGGRRRRDFEDKDWLNTSFLFYDENAQLVRVKVRDCLDTEAMRYTYQDVDIPWLSTKPTPQRAMLKTKKKASLLQQKAKAEATFPLTLTKPASATVARPRVARRGEEKEAEEEVLVVEGIQLDKGDFVKFDVYINAPDHEGVGPGATEFAGSFVHVPHKHSKGKSEKKKMMMKTVLRLGITDLLDDIGADDDDSVIVTLVPRSGEGVVIGGIRIVLS